METTVNGLTLTHRSVSDLKMGQYRPHKFNKFIVVLQCLVTIILFYSDSVKGDKSSIVFKDGYYDISVAFNGPTVNETDCWDLINALNETLFEASGYLNKVVPSVKGFGTVRILIPPSWSQNNCKVPVQGAAVRDIYEAADIKISSNHPIAMSLPWAEQQGGCGETSNTIFLPPSFLSGDTFNWSERASVFSHEWLKFRYGIFEEYGFFDDNYYSPCYRKNGSIYFTGCSSPVLLPLSNASNSWDLSPAECETLISSNLENLKSQLSTVNSSLLFASLNSVDQVGEACSDLTHAWFVNTKQNIHCDRRSSLEVIMNHKDFQNQIKENLGDDKAAKVVPTIVVVRQRAPVYQGYAFLIEKSVSISQNNRLTNIKQSIAEFVELVEGSTLGASLIYDETLAPIGDGELMQIEGAETIFLESIPDVETVSRVNASSINSADNKSMRSVFDKLYSLLAVRPEIKWNIIFITSLQPPVEAPSELLTSPNYSISVVTFDESEKWLQWNSIPQIRKLLHLPSCLDGNGVICNGLTSSLLTDYLLELLREDPSDPLFYQKIVELEMTGNEIEKSFEIPRLADSEINVNFFFPRYSDTIFPTLKSSYSGQSCSGEVVWGYPKLLIFRSESCAFQAGTWTINLQFNGSSNPSVSHVLRGFVKTNVNSPERDLIVLPSLDFDISRPIFFATQNLFVPFHVMVKTADDHPVIDAQVQTNVVYSYDNRIVKTVLNLLDDGISPDITKNDGIYSTFLAGFSPVPAYHSGSIRVTTSDSSKRIQKLSQANKAMLLDPRMNEKCCGSYIPVDSLSTVPIGLAFYSAILPSFKTGEAGGPSFYPPPSRIEIIKVVEETEDFIQINFIAPKSSFYVDSVAHYNICIVGDNRSEELCTAVNINECMPVSAGTSQDCRIYKNQLQSLLSRENTTVGDVIMIACHIRAIDLRNQHGPLSAFLIEIQLTVGLADDPSTLECKSISDDCLPIDIFWILIGCLAGVLLILIIVSCCWFWISRRRNKQEQQPRQNDRWDSNKNHNSNRSNRANTVGKSQSKKDIQHYPVDDEFDSRELYRSSFRGQNSSEMVPKAFPNNVRRQRSISAEEIHSKFQPTDMNINEHKYRTNMANHDSDMDDMPVFFANGTVTTPSHTKPTTNQYNSSFKNHERMNYDQDRRGDSKHINKYNNNNTHNATPRNFQQDDNRNSGVDFAYNPTHFHKNSNGAFPLPSISSTVDMQTSNESVRMRQPVYASVNRNGRKSGTIGTDRNSALSLPSNVVDFRNGHTSSYMNSQQPQQSNKNSPNKSQLHFQNRPQSSQSLDSGFEFSHSPVHLPPPPIRMDHFPSSESETYSEMSRVGPTVPPPPPPMPSTKRPQNSTISVNGDLGVSNRMSSSNNHTMPDDRISGSRSKTPPPTNGLGILAQMGPIPDRNSILKKPKQGPPPPPRTSLKKPGNEQPGYKQPVNSFPSSFELRKTNRDDSDKEDDDSDSDNWDVYDDFDFNPGVSHV